MKYFFIAGEASGDLHASHLIAALKAADPQAEFRGLGGDFMAAEGMTILRHYRELAYMGFLNVALHLRTILRGMKQCREEIVAWRPDLVILVDYPGFNLKIAKFVHSTALCPVYYYIAPKLWAWKEWRIKSMRRDVDEVFSILPFEVDFFEKKHGYPIHYVGNPTVDEVSMFLESHSPSPDPSPVREGGSVVLRRAMALSEKHIIALLCGSRRQEIRDNLPNMLAAASAFAPKYQLVIAGAPAIEREYYEKFTKGYNVKILSEGWTYHLLYASDAALVTSGTATLETALFRVPQVVCYNVSTPRLYTFLRRLLLKVPFVSLVNLIAGREVVKELLFLEMNPEDCRRALAAVLPGGAGREAMLAGYDEMAARLGEPGAPQRAAQLMIQLLHKGSQES